MKLIEITEKDKYNNLIKSQTRSQFLQSWEWGDFQMEINHVAKRYGLFNDNDELLTVFTLILKPLFFGWNYFYCPPVDFGKTASDFRFIFNEIRKIARQEKVLFLRFEPIGDFKFSDLDFRIIKTIDVQPSKTLVLFLKKSEEELLKEMHHKTRYNLRLAEKKRV
ncbi:MAG: peptidoglycan bridge formation glycyltransferase FemA/FemB family protein, partial [Candidatus Magasanikbacteria bacterium]|nr:peptidoglycan bridge formation glycyltransferase FemA/FemB family protein [Candidatus Magasanikbacteria bacterium]